MLLTLVSRVVGGRGESTVLLGHFPLVLGGVTGPELGQNLQSLLQVSLICFGLGLGGYYLYTGSVLFRVGWYIRQLCSSSTILYNITSITHNQYTDIWYLLSNIYIYIYAYKHVHMKTLVPRCVSIKASISTLNNNTFQPKKDYDRNYMVRTIDRLGGARIRWRLMSSLVQGGHLNNI